MYKSIISAFLLILTAFTAPAQAVWNRQHLDKVKTQLHHPMYATAYTALIRQADALLSCKPLSVMDKKRPSPTGDNHDYTSLARYFHPDSTKVDGLPYVNRDGVTNPEIALYDRTNLGTTANRVATLALAWYLSGDERYADKAASLLKVWFLDPATRMNPNLEYAQMVPGVNGGKGRSFGVLDGYSFVEMLDGVALLKGSRAWPEKDDAQLRRWMSQFLDWILTSEQGKEESNAANNHSTAYDAQAIALALYTGRNDVARRIIGEVPARRIFAQIEPDGMQPQEMWRTLSFGYSQYNLSHLIDIFMMADKLGMKIDNSTDKKGRNFYKALDLLASYLGKPVSSWPGQQISDWDGKQQLLAQDLWRVSAFVDTTRTDYRQMYAEHAATDPADRFTILFYDPNLADGSGIQPAGYPADYARAPRFNALIYYSDTAEEAHVQFADQAREFLHKLSYGEGYTYTVTTSLAPYIDRLNDFDVIIDINAMPGTKAEREAFEKYMENGGGWVGFHAAAYNDVRTDWLWFNSFLGAGIFLCNNWPPQPALLDLDTEDHPVTRNLPASFVAPASEWYQWDPSPRKNPDVEVLLTLSPRNYPIGIKDVVKFGDFPVVWTNKRYRMIYLNMGHGDDEFTDATQNLLFVNALRWVVSRSPKGDPFGPQTQATK